MSGTGGTGRNLALASSNWPLIFSFTTPERRNNETQTGKNASGAHFDKRLGAWLLVSYRPLATALDEKRGTARHDRTRITQ